MPDRMSAWSRRRRIRQTSGWRPARQDGRTPDPSDDLSGAEICQFFEMSHQRPLLTSPFRIRRIAMIVFQFLVVAATPHSSSI